MNKKWDLRFLRLAKEVASWSKDKSTKIGCVITKNKKFKSLGYNGMPAKLDDDKIERHERPNKYFYFTHAEDNALENYPRAKAKGCTAYITHFPCSACTRRLLNNKIKRIVTIKRPSTDFDERWKADMTAALDMLREAAIIIDEYEESEITNETQ